MNSAAEWLSKIIEPKMQIDDSRKILSNRFLRDMIVPLFIEQLLVMVVGLADTMMVSHAGEATVSGVSLDTMVYTIFLYIFTALATGGAVVVSQYIGSKDRKMAVGASSIMVQISLIISFLCLALMLPFGNSLLRLLYPNVEPAVMDACRIYLRIVTWSFPANALYNVGAALYRSTGRTAVTMKVSLAMNLINIVGNAIGVFVLHAGAAGVAWPTTISWYFAAACMTFLCSKRDEEVYIDWKEAVKPDPAMSMRILKIAVPNSIENGLFQLSKVILGSLVATFGTSQIAANGIGQTIWSLAATIMVAMSPVFITVVGQCMGANDPEAAEYYTRKLLRLSVLLSCVWNIFIGLLLPLMLPLYDISSQTKYYIIVIVIIHNIFCGLVSSFSGPLSGGLRAAGDVRFTMFAAIFSTVVCRVFFSFLFGKWLGMGVIGIAIAMVLDWCIRAAIQWVRFTKGTWKTMKVIG